MVNPVGTGKMAPQQGMQPAVLYKLVIFAILMAVVPIGTYFTSLNYVWNGSTTYSAISAVVMANLVLVGYVVAAFREDAAEVAANSRGSLSERRKDR